MKSNKTSKLHCFFLTMIVSSILFSSCKTKDVKPVWTSEIRWCYAIKFLSISDSTLCFMASISNNDSLQSVDFEKLSLEQKRLHTYLVKKTGIKTDTFCIELENGKYIKLNTNNQEPNLIKEICNPDKVTNVFFPNKCETEIVSDFKGYRITVESKKFIWRTSNNNSLNFIIYSNNKPISKIPITVFGSYIATKTSIYINWGPVYGKYFISKYDLDDLIK